MAIRLKAGLPDRPRDLDNVAKAALDLLQAHGVIENDVAVVDLRMRWDRVVPTGSGSDRALAHDPAGAAPGCRVAGEGVGRLQGRIQEGRSMTANILKRASRA